MRLIKFRAWDFQIKKMIYSESLESFFAAFEDLGYETPAPEIMQFTGLYDKNGKEIWEGDIVRTQPDKKISEVIFYKASFIVGPPKDLMCSIDRDCEVIGNIHETPELLK